MDYEGEKPWWRPIPKQLVKNKSNRSSQTEDSPSYRAIELLNIFLFVFVYLGFGGGVYHLIIKPLYSLIYGFIWHSDYEHKMVWGKSEVG